MTNRTRVLACRVLLRLLLINDRCIARAYNHLVDLERDR